jgi:hypothetical protein
VLKVGEYYAIRVLLSKGTDTDTRCIYQYPSDTAVIMVNPTNDEWTLHYQARLDKLLALFNSEVNRDVAN